MLVLLSHGTIERTPFGCTTRFSDGTETSNWPHGDLAYKHLVEQCGHRDNALAYCREHDLAHAYLAEKMFGKASAVLWASAHNLPPQPVADWEEKLVYYFQRFLHGHGASPDPMWVDWDGEFRGMYDRLVA